MQYLLDTSKKILNEKNKEVAPDEVYIKLSVKKVFDLQEQIQQYLESNFEAEEKDDLKILLTGVLSKSATNE